MRIISSGQSLFGATVSFEHGGKTYFATGKSRGAVISQIESAIDANANLDELFFADGNETKETESLCKAEKVIPEKEVKPESESQSKKGVKSRG